MTPEQWDACRLLVARLRSEAAQEWFNFEDIGMQWLETHDPIIVTTDVGHVLRASDLFYGAMVLLWSLVIARSVDRDCDPASIVADVGIHLALVEPET